MKYVNGKVYYRENEERELMGYLTNKLRCPFMVFNKRIEYVDGLFMKCADVLKEDRGQMNEYTRVRTSNS